jgi:hypothetical protein
VIESVFFAFPNVGKAGLGNGLFSWARAEIFAHSYGAKVLAPQWNRFRLGTYLRREPDKRRYTKFFRSEKHVYGWRRLYLLCKRRVDESAFEKSLPPCSLGVGSRVIEFYGLGDYFTPLVTSRQLIYERLLEMTVPQFRSTISPIPYVAIHVRRGDITRQGFTQGELERVNQYTNLDWFVEMAKKLTNRRLPEGCKIIVFTDGSPDEVEPLVSIPGVTLQPRQPAITDLWGIANAALLIASGYSTFSMWGSYLGRMPTIYAPGKIQQRVQCADVGAVEIELAASDEIPDAAFARFLRHG